VTFVEGISPVWQAFEHDSLEVLLLAPELARGPRIEKLIEDVRKAGHDVVELGQEAFVSIADRDNPSGIAAIARTSLRRLDDLSIGPDSLFVTLENVASPGNLGTIVRTADAVGADVVVVGESTDPWHPAAVKASMGTVFSRRVASGETMAETIDWFRSRGVTVAATSARATSEHWTTKVDLPAALVLGSERHGLGADVLEKSDVRLTIPMRGAASSLNLAVAAGILLYELRRP
jgi:TrmH family RNA methyltransferase